MSDLFLKASRLKLRFPSVRGEVTVEDLWDIPLTVRPNTQRGVCLDDIAKEVNRRLQASGETSFVEEQSSPNERLSLMLDILKFVIAAKKAESKAAVQAQEAKERRQRLLGALAKKREDAIDNMTEAEILAELGQQP